MVDTAELPEYVVSFREATTGPVLVSCAPSIDFGASLVPNSNLKGWVSFKVPQDAVIDGAVYSNSYGTTRIKL